MSMNFQHQIRSASLADTGEFSLVDTSEFPAPTHVHSLHKPLMTGHYPLHGYSISIVSG